MGRAKGSGFVLVVRFLRTQRERALVVLPPDLHHYLDIRILESSWYPQDDHLGLIRAAARLVGGHSQQTLEMFGRMAAQQHLEGIYAHLKPESDPLALPRRAFALWSSLHDSGQLKMKVEGEKQACLRVDGYATPSLETCHMTSGYIAEVCERSTMRDPAVRKTGCDLAGDEACIWEVRWR